MVYVKIVSLLLCLVAIFVCYHIMSCYEESITPFSTMTPTFTYTPTLTYTPTYTFTPTFTYTPTPTNTPTITNTPTSTVTPVPTSTVTLTPTLTPTPTLTVTPTYTPTPLNCYFDNVALQIGTKYYDDYLQLFTVDVNTQITVWFDISYTFPQGNFWKAWYEDEDNEYVYLDAGSGTTDQTFSFTPTVAGFLIVHIEGYSGDDPGTVGCEVIINFQVVD